MGRGRRTRRVIARALPRGNAADALPTEHNEVKEHAAGQLVDEAENIKPGRTAKLTVRLKPGRYILLCNLRGHYRGGMHAAFRVT
jgi:uncharacterized cupredoxin-like copper-binding protein